MRWLLAVAWICWSLTSPGLARAVVFMPGTLLVAQGSLTDPRFHEAVVLIVQHGSQGTAGLILNRPSRLSLAEALPGMALRDATDAMLCYGGPVAPRSFMALVKAPLGPPQPSQQVLPSVYLTGPQQLAAWLERVPSPPTFRVFVGYAGWAPEQLAAELARGDWHIVPVHEQLLFATEPGKLWQALAEQP